MTTPNASSPELVFIDSSVAGIDALIAGIAPDIRIYVLDPAQDGLAQMASILAGYSGLAAIHVISHGSAGSLRLGISTVDRPAIAAHADQLAAIGSALSANGDLLLYGCDVGAGAVGQSFIAALAQATGADLAASTDTTGSALTDSSGCSKRTPV